MLTPQTNIYYDKKEDIICIDYAPGTVMTQSLLEEVMAQVAELAGQLPHPVFSLSSLRDVSIAPELQPNFASFTARLLQHVRGVIRYDANQMLTNITIRTSTVLGKQQKKVSHIYPSRESALEAIRQLRQAERPQEQAG